MHQCCDCDEVYDMAKAGYRPLCLRCQVDRAEHPQVFTKYGFPVDKDIKDLVEFLNDRKIETCNSCQNQGPELNDVSWIHFRSHDAVVRLLQCISKEDKRLDEYLYQHGNWHETIDGDSSSDDDDGDVKEVHYHLRFPAEDLSYVTSRVLHLTEL